VTKRFAVRSSTADNGSTGYGSPNYDGSHMGRGSKPLTHM